MRRVKTVSVTVIALALSARNAFALAAPVAGTFAYDIYDIAVMQMLQGPIGFVAASLAIVFGAVLAIQGRVIQAVPAVLGGALLLKADAIVTTLGAIG